MSAIHPMQTGNTFNAKGNNQNNNNKRVQKRKANPLDKAREVDYLDAKFLTRFTNDQGKILPRRITGVNAFQQRQISQAIKHARHLALLSFVANDLN